MQLVSLVNLQLSSGSHFYLSLQSIFEYLFFVYCLARKTNVLRLREEQSTILINMFTCFLHRFITYHSGLDVCTHPYQVWLNIFALIYMTSCYAMHTFPWSLQQKEHDKDLDLHVCCYVSYGSVVGNCDLKFTLSCSSCWTAQWATPLSSEDPSCPAVHYLSWWRLDRQGHGPASENLRMILHACHWGCLIDVQGCTAATRALRTLIFLGCGCHDLRSWHVFLYFYVCCSGVRPGNFNRLCCKTTASRRD